MEKKVFKKENGEVKLINVDKELLHYIESTATNPCINCQKGYVTRCSKMADENKNIAKYDFITDGYQVNNHNGETLNLVVSKCLNFEVDKPREKGKTKKEIEALEHLKESIKILYFDGIDIGEADQIQRDLIRRGQIADVESPTAYREFMKKLGR